MYIGYKKAIGIPDHKPVIVRIIIPNDALHNILRTKNNRDILFAKHRCSKCLVSGIVDPITNIKYNRAVSFYQPVGKTPVYYNVGEMSEPDGYEWNEDKVCAEGIHFFVSYIRACCYKNPTFDVDFQIWFDNGGYKYRGEMSSVNGVKKLNGLFLEYNIRGEIVKQLQVNNNYVSSHFTIYLWKDLNRNKRIADKKTCKLNNPTHVTDIIPELSEFIKV